MGNETQEKLQALFISYAKKLPDKITALENQWKLLSNAESKDQLQEFHREIHSLCGSAGTYGYSALGKSARELEIYLKGLLNNHGLTALQKRNIQTLFDKLKTVALESTPDILSQFNIGEDKKDVGQKLVYLVHQDEHSLQLLTEYLKDNAYQIFNINDIHDLAHCIEEKKPIVIILGIDNLETQDIEELSKLQKAQKISIPIICIAKNSDILTRLRAIRLGSIAFFTQPFDPYYLGNFLNELSETLNIPYRVLIIDDSASLAEYYGLILQEAGMQTKAITNPLKIIEAIEEFQPDLLLMDIYMPKCTGLELAVLLRQEPAYANLPIIFLSTEDDKFKQLTALSLGGDDFLTKPVVPQHLISTVMSRARRAGFLNVYMTTDSLTHLLNHSNFLQHLDMEIAHTERQKSELSLVMIDIDHFKKVNDRFGHLVGDKVIKRLSSFLLTHLRKIDSVGRYGGEEFAIIFPGAQVEKGMEICRRLIREFAQIRFVADDVEFSVTLSMGIAGYPMFRDKLSLLAAADKALYQAKNNGRNQICCYE